MKYLLILPLLGCSLAKYQPDYKPPVRQKEKRYTRKLEDCMLRFSKEGYKAESVIKLCEAIHGRRD